MPSQEQGRFDEASRALAAVLDRVDPELRAAASDVDRTLLAWSMSLSPLERLRASSRAAAALGRFRRVGGDD
ncbi:MAG: hypothetical protein KC933_11070 [Myxococcales bacterium]|nr:hypothetical protein [Myxococcales bacterium]MCB9651003.1 hypothetical protein [Deltaproteobacteria bacterium]